MKEIKETGQNQDPFEEVPEFIGIVNSFIGELDDDTKLADLFNPQGFQKHYPEGWITVLGKLTRQDKALLDSTIGAARVSGFETARSIRESTTQEIIAQSTASPEARFRRIGFRRAVILKGIFERNTAGVKNG